MPASTPPARRVADHRRRRARPVAPRSAGRCSARASGCWPRTTRPRRCCSCPSRRARGRARRSATGVPDGKRVVAAFVGAGPARTARFEVHPTLEAAALAAAARARRPTLAASSATVDERRGRSAGRRVLGLFSGGSLAHEAAAILRALAIGPSAAGRRVSTSARRSYTQGRPHPMVDLDMRVELLERAARRRRRRLRAARRRARPRRAPRPGRRAGARGRPDRRPRDGGRARLRHAADPQDADAPGGGAARRRRDRRAVQRGGGAARRPAVAGPAR